MLTTSRRLKRSSWATLAFVGVFAVVGTLLLIIARAATSAVAFETESGKLSLPASIVADASSSNGHAVKFASPTPRPTPPPGLNPKKGVGASKYTDNISKIMALKVSWFYNWSSTNIPPDDGGLDYVPMIWGASSATQARVDSLIAGKQAGLYTSLLGFNEPDHAGQANMTVDTAISLWPLLQSTGLRLGAPAVASIHSLTNTSTPGVFWIDDFMTKATQKGYRVDFIPLHIYQDWTNPNAVTSLKANLQAVYDKYHKPIWITEIGTIDIATAWGGTMKYPATFTGAKSYMQQVIPMLNSLPFVERYAWFSINKWDATNPTGDHNYTSLYDNLDNLTDLGKAYVNLN